MEIRYFVVVILTSGYPLLNEIVLPILALLIEKPKGVQTTHRVAKDCHPGVAVGGIGVFYQLSHLVKPPSFVGRPGRTPEVVGHTTNTDVTNPTMLNKVFDQCVKVVRPSELKRVVQVLEIFGAAVRKWNSCLHSVVIRVCFGVGVPFEVYIVDPTV